MLPIVTILTLSYQRHTLLERSLYAFLEQDYEGHLNLLIFNTGDKIELDKFEIPENKRIILINSDKEYNSVGEKYLEALKYIPEDTILVEIVDDDDYLLPEAIRLNVEGILKFNKVAYKPRFSYFKSEGKISLAENVHEGSIIMNYEHLKKYGFLKDKSVKYHDGWLQPLIQNDDILVDPEGTPVWVYDWSTPVPIYKMSGRLESQENYEDSKIRSVDMGDGILTPDSKYAIRMGDI